jgi:hypothetical protein
MLTVHPPSFIETEDCDGPRYTRGQPSRETPGVLMTEMQNKYITEFELPYRNIERYIKEIGNNWDRLDDKQRQLVRKSFQGMGLIGKVETFADVGSSEEVTPNPATSNGTSSVDPNVSTFIKFLATNPSYNTPLFMDTLWNTKSDQVSQLGITNDQLYKIKDSMYEWSVDNSYTLHSNWRSGLILFFFFLIVLILIIALAAGGNNGGDREFGKSLFGRRFRI